MSDDHEHHKTIMIRRPAAGATETPQPAAQQPAKKPEPAKEDSSWLKSPLGILAIVVAAIVATVVLVKFTGK